MASLRDWRTGQMPGTPLLRVTPGFGARPTKPIITIHQVDIDLEAAQTLFFNMLEKNNTISDKRFIYSEEELGKLVALMGEKMEMKFDKIMVDLGAVVEEANG